MTHRILFDSSPFASDTAMRFGRIVRSVLAACALLVLGGGSVADAKIFLTVDEGLELAFPDCTVQRKTVFLTEDQIESAAKKSGLTIPSPVVYPYEATCDGEHAGIVFLDTHRVRTMAETLMIVIDAEGRVNRIEILAFREPEEYIPRANWYDQFTHRPLTSELRMKRGIRGVTGATLTAHATTDAVRRSLALFETLYAKSESEADAAEEREE